MHVPMSPLTPTSIKQDGTGTSCPLHQPDGGERRRGLLLLVPPLPPPICLVPLVLPTGRALGTRRQHGLTRRVLSSRAGVRQTRPRTPVGPPHTKHGWRQPSKTTLLLLLPCVRTMAAPVLPLRSEQQFPSKPAQCQWCRTLQGMHVQLCDTIHKCANVKATGKIIVTLRSTAMLKGVHWRRVRGGGQPETTHRKSPSPPHRRGAPGSVHCTTSPSPPPLEMKSIAPFCTIVTPPSAALNSCTEPFAFLSTRAAKRLYSLAFGVST